MSYRTKNTSLWIVIGIVVVSMLVLGFIGNITGGFQNFEAEYIREKLYPVNKDNFYQDSTITNMQLQEGAFSNGLTVTKNANGSITVEGKASSDVKMPICTVSLANGGYYTITALENFIPDTCYVSVEYGETSVNADFSDTRTINLTGATDLKLYFNVDKGTTVNVTLYPVIVSGNEAGSFFE